MIIRNLGIKKVLADNGDAIGIRTSWSRLPSSTANPSAEYSTNVWVDHCDVSSDMTHGKDYYDGLIDVSRLRIVR